MALVKYKLKYLKSIAQILSETKYHEKRKSGNLQIYHHTADVGWSGKRLTVTKESFEFFGNNKQIKATFFLQKNDREMWRCWPDEWERRHTTDERHFVVYDSWFLSEDQLILPDTLFNI